MKYEYQTAYIYAASIKKKGMFKSSNIEVNGDDLAKDIAAACFDMSEEGFELFQNIPINSTKTYMSSYPYSFTDGVVLIFRKAIKTT